MNLKAVQFRHEPELGQKFSFIEANRKEGRFIIPIL